jgi:alkaline phosphatase D
LPCRQPDPLNPERLYRTLHYGPLADIMLLDCDQYQGVDTLPTGEPSFLGEVQNAWLEGEIAASNARWRLVGSQKMFGQWSTAGIPGLPIGNGQVADPGSWDGFPASRTRLLNYLAANGKDNFIFLTGDLHLSMATDVAVDPFGGAYDPNTGNGSIAVEFLPTSVTRGNFDEYGIPGFLIPGIKLASDAINEHHFYSELTQHGYGVLDLKADSAIAQFWYVDILNANAGQTLGQELVVGNRQNHWARGPLVTVTTPQPAKALFSVFPNPAKEQVVVEVSEPLGQPAQLSLVELASGREIRHWEWNANGQQKMAVSLQGISAGSYLLHIRWGEESAQLRIVKE